MKFKKGCENINIDCLSRTLLNSRPSTDSTINNEVIVHELCEASIFQISTRELTFQSI